MSDPWVKIKKKITQWEWYKDTPTRSVFLHLIFTCNYKPSRYQGHDIGVGQVVTGRKQLSIDLGLSEQQIRRALDNLADNQQITIKTTNKFSVVTVCDYQKHQVNENKQPSKQPTNEQQTQHQTPSQTTTSKELNNYINILLTTGASEEVVIEFLNHRKTHTKKPKNTEYAIKLVASKLLDLKNKGHDPTELLNTAIEKNWITVYEPNEWKGNKNGNNKHSKQASRSERADAAVAEALAEANAGMEYTSQPSGTSELRHAGSLRQRYDIIENDNSGIFEDA